MGRSQFDEIRHEGLQGMMITHHAIDLPTHDTFQMGS